MALETVLLQIEMGRGRVKIRVKIIVLETVPLQIEMRRRRVKIRVKIIVLETVPFQIEMKGRRAKIRVKIIVLETVAKWQKCASKRLPARIWPKTAVFPMIPDEKFNSRPRGRQMAESCFQKAPGQDLAKNGQWHWRPSCFKLK